MRTDFVGIDGMCGWIPAIEIQIQFRTFLRYDVRGFVQTTPLHTRCVRRGARLPVLGRGLAELRLRPARLAPARGSCRGASVRPRPPRGPPSARLFRSFHCFITHTPTCLTPHRAGWIADARPCYQDTPAHRTSHRADRGVRTGLRPCSPRDGASWMQALCWCDERALSLASAACPRSRPETPSAH